MNIIIYYSITITSNPLFTSHSIPSCQGVLGAPRISFGCHPYLIFHSIILMSTCGIVRVCAWFFCPSSHTPKLLDSRRHLLFLVLREVHQKTRSPLVTHRTYQTRDSNPRPSCSPCREQQACNNKQPSSSLEVGLSFLATENNR